MAQSKRPWTVTRTLAEDLSFGMRSQDDAALTEALLGVTGIVAPMAPGMATRSAGTKPGQGLIGQGGAQAANTVISAEDGEEEPADDETAEHETAEQDAEPAPQPAKRPMPKKDANGKFIKDEPDTAEAGGLPGARMGTESDGRIDRLDVLTSELQSLVQESLGRDNERDQLITIYGKISRVAQVMSERINPRVKGKDLYEENKKAFIEFDTLSEQSLRIAEGLRDGRIPAYAAKGEANNYVRDLVAMMSPLAEALDAQRDTRLKPLTK